MSLLQVRGFHASRPAQGTFLLWGSETPQKLVEECQLLGLIPLDCSEEHVSLWDGVEIYNGRAVCIT
jgi:hypothetical protein